MSTKLISTGLALALMTTGCGFGKAGPGQTAVTPTATGSLGAQQETALVRQLVQCVRRNGAPNFPDPIKDKRTGEWELPPGAKEPPKSVMRPCRSLLDRLERNDRDRARQESKRPLTAAQMVTAKKHAECMRQHGLADWPDPDTYGIVHLPRRYERLGKTGIRTQLVACKKYIVPGTGISIEGDRRG